MKANYEFLGLKVNCEVAYLDPYSKRLLETKEKEDNTEVVVFNRASLEDFLETVKTISLLDKKVAELWKTTSQGKAEEIVLLMKTYLQKLHDKNLVQPIRYYVQEIKDYSTVMEELKKK